MNRHGLVLGERWDNGPIPQVWQGDGKIEELPPPDGYAYRTAGAINDGARS